jgi:effector-binding domain-containing protein
MIESIGVEERAEQVAAVVRGRCTSEEIGPFVGPAYEEVLTVLGVQGLHPVGPPICCYARGDDGMDEQGRADVFRLAAGFPTGAPVEATGRVEPMVLPGGTAVVAIHLGYYQELGEAYAAVAQHMVDHGLEPAGDTWETYLDGPEVEVHRTVLTTPCRPRS